MDAIDDLVSFSGMPSDLFHVRILQCEHLVIDRRWNAQNVRSPYWRIYVNDRDGAEIILAGGRRFPLPSGRIHVIPAWVEFTCRSITTIEHLYAHLEVMGLPGPLGRELFPRPLSLTLDHVSEAQATLLKSALRHAPTAPATGCLMQSWSFGILGRLLTMLSASDTDKLTRSLLPVGPLQPALAMITERLDRPVSNQELAANCGLSVDHFIRRFRQQLGQTPAQFVLERRLVTAAQHLVLTQETVSAIATACGFPDRYYFTRAFTRRMGLPPAAYRARGQV
jgi:AraC-like DNA-binding protein